MAFRKSQLASIRTVTGIFGPLKHEELLFPHHESFPVTLRERKLQFLFATQSEFLKRFEPLDIYRNEPPSSPGFHLQTISFFSFFALSSVTRRSRLKTFWEHKERLSDNHP